ncbi:protein of unknown function [Paenibacillus sp. UNCCL117]|uniref:carbohydrate-binding domain-containing protein n=1 Tax=unclassified Paenibacillus TaxID=185978 RepID=UPI0008870BC0|nr:MULTISPECIES: carbohydrate-binding domain-containing protein [unclassified Paenibacillus]SDC15628.1 protein of unknown function [Paenibacillus sp. cl123]SFW17595.1 protein of unknown function [Paenibacillus sp. UNCCL117]
MKKGSNTSKLWSVLLCVAVLSACSTPADPAASQAGTAESAAAAAKSSGDGASAAQTSAQTQVSADMPEKATFKEADLKADWSQETAIKIQLNGADAAIDGSGAKAAGGGVVITAPGTYVLSGKLSDGQIIVEAGDKDDVQLVLNGVDLRSSDSAPLYVKAADKVILTLQEGTENTVSDGETYVYPDASSDEPSAAIFSKADLAVNGKGKLAVQGRYNDGIASKDDLIITGGTIEIQAKDDGIIGRDLVAVQDVTLTIQAGGDGIKTTNDTDASKGNIVVAGGSFTIAAGSDGMQAAASVRLDGGSFDIKAGGGSVNGAVKTEDFRQAPRGAAPAPAATEQATAAEPASTKGVKAAANIFVASGSFNIDSADDAVHSNGHIVIAGGELKLASGDDGIHADASITITGGKTNIVKSYEGIESSLITFQGGETYVTATDDGVNVAGGKDESALGGRPGQNQLASTGNNRLVVSGGYLSVDAVGDGLDANGSIEMSGGTVLVNGPTNNGNAALDYDGSFALSGGLLIAAGSAGMAMAPSDTSAQYAIVMSYPQTQSAGTLVRLADGSGNDIATFTPSKAYQTVVISSPGLKKDASYTLYSGGSVQGGQSQGGLTTGGQYVNGTRVVTFTPSASVTWLNESGVTAAASAGHGGPGGGMGGGPAGRMGGGPAGGMGGGRNRPMEGQTTPAQ